MTETHVLLAGVDVDFFHGLRARLEERGFSVRVCRTGLDVLESARAERVDAVVVESRLLDVHGTELCRDLRGSGCLAPILVCTDAEAPAEAVLSYEAGADDYFAKSLDATVIEAKLGRALRRTMQRTTTESELERRTPSTLPAGVEARALTRFEERLLLVLSATPGEVVSTETIAAELWGRPGVDARSLYEHVSTLRAKLRSAGWTVTNVRGKGYRLDHFTATAGERWKRMPLRGANTSSENRTTSEYR